MFMFILEMKIKLLFTCTAKGNESVFQTNVIKDPLLIIPNPLYKYFPSRTYSINKKFQLEHTEFKS